MADDFRRSSAPTRPRPSVPSSRRDARVRGTAAPTEVAYAIQSLSRAARSFSLYDPHNDAVKMLIADYKEKMAAIARSAPIEVDVQPFEMTYNDEVIYQEADRERSLAFRLFRDGVRRVRFQENVTWNELVTLLEVLSVRCNGVRQQEEDLVTLLRRAAFAGILVESVEGYTPDEERPEQAWAPALASSDDDTHEPPEGWDQPLPEPGAPTKIAYEAVEDSDLEALRAEESTSGLTEQAVRAVTEVLQAAYGLRDVRFRDEVMPFLDEVQEYLLVERNLKTLGQLSAIYQRILGAGTPLPALRQERAFERLIRSVPETESAVPPELGPLLDLVPGDHTRRAFAMLDFSPRGARRAALIDVVKKGCATEPGTVVERLPAAAPDLAKALFDVLGDIAPDRQIEAAFELLGHPDESFLLTIADVLEGAPRGVRLVRGLQRLMESPFEAVRVKAMGTLAKIGGPRSVPLLAEHARKRAQADMTAMEADAVGAAMAAASPSDALPVFLEWTRASKGIRTLFAKLSKEQPAEQMLAYAAIAGLEVCPGRDSEAAIEAVLARASGALQWRCQAAIDRRREGGSHG